MIFTSIINGVETSQIDVSDRGFQFGDGVFETLAIRNGTPCFLGRHLSRLKQGCERLKILRVNYTILRDDILQLVVQYPDAVLKIIVTRGCTERGYRFADELQPNIVMRVYDIHDHPQKYAEQGITVHLCKTRISLQPLLAGIKHMNRLEQIMARNEWDDVTAQEGLMMDINDHLIDGTMSNLFYIKNGCLITSDLAESGVAGVMRSVLLDMAESMNMETRIEAVTMDDIKIADEVFMSNSLVGIWPVSSISGIAEYKIGDATKSLQKLLPEWQQVDKSEDWYCR